MLPALLRIGPAQLDARKRWLELLWLYR